MNKKLIAGLLLLGLLALAACPKKDAGDGGATPTPAGGATDGSGESGSTDGGGE